jgi:hypothetical protein
MHAGGSALSLATPTGALTDVPCDHFPCFFSFFWCRLPTLRLNWLLGAAVDCSSFSAGDRPSHSITLCEHLIAALWGGRWLGGAGRVGAGLTRSLRFRRYLCVVDSLLSQGPG